ncbi:ribonuclease H-like domain-containing protein [Tanacetum coccineum]
MVEKRMREFGLIRWLESRVEVVFHCAIEFKIFLSWCCLLGDKPRKNKGAENYKVSPVAMQLALHTRNKSGFINGNASKTHASVAGFNSKVPDGDWLGHPSDQVLSVLKDKIKDLNQTKSGPYEICHKAKKTREPFPIIDHKSSGLGDLDVWGLRSDDPYNDEGDSAVGSNKTTPNNSTNCPRVNIVNEAAKDQTNMQTDNTYIAGLLGSTSSRKDNEDTRYATETGVSEGMPGTILSDDEYESEGEDVGYFGQLFESPELAVGQNVRRSSKKSSMPSKEGIDYEETFSPVMKIVTIRCILSIADNNKWPLFQLDINNAFLYGELEEDVYMSIPEGYSDKDDKRVCKLVKSLYGLKQAPRKWNEKLTYVLIDNGFVQSLNDFSLFMKNDNDVMLILLVYVDDIIVTGNNVDEINKFK